MPPDVSAGNGVKHLAIEMRIIIIGNHVENGITNRLVF